MHIETERLIIRDFTADDWEDVHIYAKDPLVTRYMLWGPNTEEETKSFIARVLAYQQVQPRLGYELAVTLRENNWLIGGCGIHLEGRNGEIGYSFRPEYWRQGYATEASQALLAQGFNQFGLHRIYATCRPDNIGSAKVLEKIGMTKEGFLREHLWSKNKYHSSFLFSILEHEYRELPH